MIEKTIKAPGKPAGGLDKNSTANLSTTGVCKSSTSLFCSQNTGATPSPLVRHRKCNEDSRMARAAKPVQSE
ncbi:MAG: hypothetical protein MI923_27960 [Phycisphaerales bacterium]|nr:hypothetical protein [Phycisphaerales bacterium]